MYKNYVIYINTFFTEVFFTFNKVCVYENFSVKNMK